MQPERQKGEGVLSAREGTRRALAGNCCSLIVGSVCPLLGEATLMDVWTKSCIVSTAPAAMSDVLCELPAL